MTEVKTCQFCGGEIIWVNGSISVPCANCLPQDPTTPDSADHRKMLKQAIEAWDLRQMVESAERVAFEAWASKTGWRERMGMNGEYREMAAAWSAWQASAQHHRPCRGVRHPNCNYLAPCGSICEKCGQAT